MDEQLNSTDEFLRCEYCDTMFTNPYYVKPDANNGIFFENTQFKPDLSHSRNATKNSLSVIIVVFAIAFITLTIIVCLLMSTIPKMQNGAVIAQTVADTGMYARVIQPPAFL